VILEPMSLPQIAWSQSCLNSPINTISLNYQSLCPFNQWYALLLSKFVVRVLHLHVHDFIYVVLLKIDWLNLYSPKHLHFRLVYSHFILSFALLSKRAYIWHKLGSSFTINFFNLLHRLIFRLIIVRHSWATRSHPNSSINHSRRFWFYFLSRLL